MFLVEIEAGREVLFNSVDALADAIRRGEVGPRSRIFHRVSSSWISITLHPEFKKATATQGSEPLPPLARMHWTFFGTEPKGREIDETPPKSRDAEQPTRRASESPSGLRRLLARAFRRHAATPKTSETSST